MPPLGPQPPKPLHLVPVLLFFFFLSIAASQCHRSSSRGGLVPLDLTAALAESGIPVPGPGIRLNEAILLEFNTNLDPESVTPESLQVLEKGSDPPRFAQGEFSVRDEVLRFVPQPPLRSDRTDSGFRAGTDYQIVLRGGDPGIRSVFGTPLEDDVFLDFRTTERAPFYLEDKVGPPEILGFALDRDGDGVLLTDGDLSTLEREEFLSDSGFMPDDVPVGLARAPIAIQLVVDDVLDPTTLFETKDPDRLRPNTLQLFDVNHGAEVAHRTSLRSVFLAEKGKYQSLILVVPERTLPRGSRLEIRLGLELRDLVGEFLSPLNPEVVFFTRIESGVFQDRFTEEFDDRRHRDPSSDAEWGAPLQGALFPADGLSGTGSLGPLIVSAERSITLETSSGGRFDYSTVHVEEGAQLFLAGRLPAEIFARESMLIEGSIVVDGEAGFDGKALGGLETILGGRGGPGAGTGGAANDPPGIPIANDDCQLGQPGESPRNGGGQGGKISTEFVPGGGGGGYSRPGGQSVGSIRTPGGERYGDRELQDLLGGSGGGGGGDGSPGELVPVRGENTGGGGGGGGGAILLSTRGTMTLTSTSTISARGGDGGRGGPGQIRTPGGGGGGGGSGGAIKLRASRIALPVALPTEIRANGGNGGLNGGPALVRGGQGADGRIRIEILDTNRNGSVDPEEFDLHPRRVHVQPTPSLGLVDREEARKSFAQSTFFDTGIRTPRFRFDATDPGTGLVRDDPEVRDLVFRDGFPSQTTVRILFEGTHEDPLRPGRPRLDSIVGPTPQIELLNGLRYIRFRIEFEIDDDLELSTRPKIERIQIPFEFEF